MKWAWIILIELLLGDFCNLARLQSATAKELPKLEIIRKIKTVVEKKAPKKPADPDALITRIIVVPPTFLSYGFDAFADEGPKTRSTAKQILEAAGIPFPYGTSAIYNPGTSQLIIRQTFDRLTQVELFLEKLRGEEESVIHFRFEIFQLSTPLARKILEESRQTQMHSLLRDSVFKLLATRQAIQVRRINLLARKNYSGGFNGYSTGFSEGPEYHLIVDYKRDNRSNQLLPVFESRNAGTKILVRPLESKDDSSIPFEFTFEFHFATPEIKTTEIRNPESQKILVLQAPEFHSIKLSGDKNTVMKNNSVRLIGSYQVALDDKNENSGQTGIVFLKASLKKIR